jgi:hypothetical protein
MLVYTSVTKSYIPKARVLAKSVKQFHPGWTFVLFLSDSYPEGFQLRDEPFDKVLTLESLDMPNWRSWAFGHSIVELCTAVKGPAAELLALEGKDDRIMYLDPDIKVFASLEPLSALLDHHDILLTPHLLDAEETIGAVRDNEISALKHGIYNLGFFAARTSGQGLEFIRWWSNRLYHFCTDDIPNGLFTDQRWCDLAPGFFDRLGIVRDRGCNVATWNVAHRPLGKDRDGTLLAGSTPLRFYHFTGYDSGDGFAMLRKYASDQHIANEIWDGYRADLNREGHGESCFQDWKYGSFDDGQPIFREARMLYRSREDLKQAFPDPYSTAEPSYRRWLESNFTGEWPVQSTRAGGSGTGTGSLFNPVASRVKFIRKLSKSIRKRLPGYGR